MKSLPDTVLTFEGLACVQKTVTKSHIVSSNCLETEGHNKIDVFQSYMHPATLLPE